MLWKTLKKEFFEFLVLLSMVLFVFLMKSICAHQCCYHWSQIGKSERWLKPCLYCIVVEPATACMNTFSSKYWSKLEGLVLVRKHNGFVSCMKSLKTLVFCWLFICNISWHCGLYPLCILLLQSIDGLWYLSVTIKHSLYPYEPWN